MLISLNNIKKSFLDKIILDNVTLSVNDNDRIGLLGINGVGKTTLLNIITGSIDYDDGTVSRNANLKIGYLKQNEALDTSNTLEEEIQNALKDVFETRKQLKYNKEVHALQTKTNKLLKIFL
mgnify:CR=1 FL=1